MAAHAATLTFQVQLQRSLVTPVDQKLQAVAGAVLESLSLLRGGQLRLPAGRQALAFVERLDQHTAHISVDVPLQPQQAASLRAELEGGLGGVSIRVPGAARVGVAMLRRQEADRRASSAQYILYHVATPFSDAGSTRLLYAGLASLARGPLLWVARLRPGYMIDRWCASGPLPPGSLPDGLLPPYQRRGALVLATADALALSTAAEPWPYSVDVPGGPSFGLAVARVPLRITAAFPPAPGPNPGGPQPLQQHQHQQQQQQPQPRQAAGAPPGVHVAQEAPVAAPPPVAAAPAHPAAQAPAAVPRARVEEQAQPVPLPAQVPPAAAPAPPDTPARHAATRRDGAGPAPAAGEQQAGGQQQQRGARPAGTRQQDPEPHVLPPLGAIITVGGPRSTTLGVVVRHFLADGQGWADVLTHHGHIHLLAIGDAFTAREWVGLGHLWSAARLRNFFTGKQPLQDSKASAALTTFNAHVRPHLEAFAFGHDTTAVPDLSDAGSEYATGSVGSEHDRRCLRRARHLEGATGPRSTARGSGRFPATPAATAPEAAPATPRRWWHSLRGPGA